MKNKHPWNIRALALTGWLTALPLFSTQAALRAAWEFNAGDISGVNVSATDGTAANTTGTLEADADISDGLLVLDGTGDYLKFGNNVTGLRALSAMTLCAWVRAGDSGTAMRRIFEHEDNIYFWQENGRYRFTIHGSPASGTAISTTAPKPGTWHHVLVTYQAGQPAGIYVNGVWEADSSGNLVAMPNNTQTLQIGARRSASGTPSNFYYGNIDDVAVWDTILSPEQIEALAGRGSGGYTGRARPTAIDDFIVTQSATAIGTGDATLNGTLVSTSSVPAEVRVYWGTADGGSDATAWANTNVFGTVDPGLLSTNITGLTADTEYFFRFYAANADGGHWASESLSFITYRDLPDDISGLQLWLRPDAAVFSDGGTTPAAGGDPVLQWNDLSGNGRNATRVGSLGNLVLEDAALNGMPVIRVTDASGGDYLHTLGYEAADTDDLTVFIVSRADPQSVNGTAIHPLVGSGSPYNGSGCFWISTMRPNLGGPGNLGYFGRSYNPFPYDEYTKNGESPNFSDGKGHVIALTLSGASTGGTGTFTGIYDGEVTEIHNGTTANPANGPVEIVGSDYSTSARYAGAIGDVIIYDRVLDADEMNRVGWYLQHKYALEGSYVNPYGVKIANAAPTAVLKTSATLNGEVLDGDMPAEVTVYWGPTDGGTDPAAWANTNHFGTITAPRWFSTNITGLTAGTNYFYRFYGTNIQGDTWAGSTQSFSTWRYLPDDFSALQLWLKADDGVFLDSGSTSATNGSVVQQWNDYSGNNRHATRVGTSGNLICQFNTLGGMPAVKLTDASGGDYLNVSSYQVEDNDDLTVFVVSRAAPQTVNGSAIHPLVGSGNPSQGGCAFMISTMRPNAGGPGNLGYFGRSYNPYPYDEYTKDGITPNFADGLGHVIALGLSGASTGGAGTFTGYYDGAVTEIHDGTSSNPANGTIEIGGNSLDPSRRYAGVFGDILIYNRVLTGEERNKIGWYLQTKYSLSGDYRNPFEVVITNAPATNVQQTSADFNAYLIDGDLPAEVTLYWGTSDGGTEASAWSNTNVLGDVGAYGLVATNITGLTPGTIYYYRFFGSNTQGGRWSDATTLVNTLGPPIVATGDPNMVDFTSAVLQGTLISTSGAPTQVWIYWGTTDEGADAGAWDTSITLGNQPAGGVQGSASPLAANTTYHYRLYAENSFGGRWASESRSFRTPFMPNIETDGLVLWLRADADVTHSGGLVDSWADQATSLGGANNAAGSGASRPAILFSALNGYPALQFDGTDDWLSVADNDALDIGTGAGKGCTLVAVYRRTGTTGVWRELVSKTTGASDGTDWRFFTQGGNVIWGTGISGDPEAWMPAAEPTSTAFHILAGTLDQTGATSGDKVLYIDGSEVASGSYTEKAPANTEPVRIGGFSASSGNMQGYVAEILVYNRKLSARDLSNVGWYLQEKYNLSGAYEYVPPSGTVIIVH